MKRVILFYTFLLLNMSCNKIFYHPDQVIYSNPADLNLTHEFSTIKTADSQSLHILKIIAKQERGIVIQFHGNAQNLSSHHLSVAWMTYHGFSVYAFDYRGYGQSSGKPTRKGLVLDGQAMIQYVCSQGKKPVFMVGQSIGGAVAIPALALKKNACVKGLILDSTFSSYRSVAFQKLKSNLITYFLARPLSYLISDEYSPIDYVNELNIPIMMLHSLEDPIVPLQEGKALFEHIHYNDKEFVSVHRPGHIASFSDPRDPYRKKALDFFIRHSN